MCIRDSVSAHRLGPLRGMARAVDCGVGQPRPAPACHLCGRPRVCHRRLPPGSRQGVRRGPPLGYRGGLPAR
eukprot:4860031-Alexandrium_andersonii.AAC.1